jgi:MFS family permease
LKHSRFRHFLMIVFIFTLGSSSDAFLMLRAYSLGVSPAGIFVIFALLNLLTTISSYPAGILSDKVSRRKIILAAWIVYMLVYLGFAVATEQWHCWVLFIIYGIFYGLTEGVERALVADLIPKELRGTAYGLYNGVLGIGLLPASLIAGLLWENFGASAPFFWGAGLALISSIALSQMHFTKQHQ